ncbi:hypothetical protein PC128_g17027 [Phytophthora cactorum]|nr:hypothetical protein PC128_g17027 [Phytophthora cactorum]
MALVQRWHCSPAFTGALERLTLPLILHVLEAPGPELCHVRRPDGITPTLSSHHNRGGWHSASGIGARDGGPGRCTRAVCTIQLSAISGLVKFPDFENGVVKVLAGKVRTLYRTEKAAVANLVGSSGQS